MAGGTGSGKTTIAHAIIERVGRERIALVQRDAYYRDQSGKPPEARARVNYDHPDSLETELMIEHLKQLRAGHLIEMPVYDFATHTRQPETRRVEPHAVILVEGILIFADPALRAMFDVKVLWIPMQMSASSAVCSAIWRNAGGPLSPSLRSIEKPCARCTWNLSSPASVTPTSSCRRADTTPSALI
jgi:hypothetical protein